MIRINIQRQQRRGVDRRRVMDAARVHCMNELIRLVADVVVSKGVDLRGEYLEEMRTLLRTNELSTGERIGSVAVVGETGLQSLIEGEVLYAPDYVAVPINSESVTQFTSLGLGSTGGGVTLGGVYYLNVPPGSEAEYNNLHAGLYQQLPREGRNNRLLILAAYLPMYPVQQIVADAIGQDYLGRCYQNKVKEGMRRAS